MTRRATRRARQSGIGSIPTRSIFNDEADSLTSPQRKRDTNLNRFLYDGRDKDFDIPVATFDRMK